MKNSILFILLCSFSSFSQVVNIEVINKKEIKYYYVYEAINQKTPTDTLLLLSFKEKIKEFDEEVIDLEVGGVYTIETREISAIKQSDGIFHLSRHGGGDIVDNVRIANKKGELPILITSYKKIGSFDIKYRYTEKVSIIEVIANLKKFDGKQIVLKGYLVFDSEKTAIYLSKEDYLYGITKNAIYIYRGSNFSNELESSGKWKGQGYAQVEGIFSTALNGHNENYSGSLIEFLDFNFIDYKTDK